MLCCDEKSQVQALDRTQPGLPLKKGRAQTMTHDYKRHGTTTLFAALNVLDGQVIGQCQQRHTHAEWLKFLRKIDRETPKNKTLHLIADSYATHKHPVVQEWLAKHPRFNMHFTPTSASWLNMVERFFRDITTERLRRGVFTSVPELENAIKEYGPLVVSCGTQQSESMIVVEPGGHVVRLHLSLSTCPRGNCWEHGIEHWIGGAVHQRVGAAAAVGS